VRGVPSAGITSALLNLRDRYAELDLPGTAYFRQLALGEDPMKSLAGVLSSDRGPANRSLGDSSADGCVTHIIEQDIRLLIFDRCHNVSRESLDRLLDLIDLCVQSDRPIGLVLGGRSFYHTTLPWTACDRSKVARSVVFPLLDRDHCMSVLTYFSPRFEPFCADFLDGRGTAMSVAEEIHKITNGRIGELRKLFDYLNYLHPKGFFSATEILRRARELILPGFNPDVTSGA
jgi:hypothetical protein